MDEQHQQLIQSNQELFHIMHKHIVNEIVKRNGYFSPIGIGITPSGEYLIAGIDSSDPVNALGFTIQVLREQARQRKIIISAICFSNTIPHAWHNDGIDQINIVLEDAAHIAVHCHLTYQRILSEWKFGDTRASAGDPIVFERQSGYSGFNCANSSFL